MAARKPVEPGKTSAGGGLDRRAPTSSTAKHLEVDAFRLLHELDVHKVELKAQNEELIEARQEAETALDRYTALFDFAPIGYALLRADGSIVEVNYAGAELLGQPRSRIVARTFAEFMVERAAWRAVLTSVLASETKETLEATVVGATPRYVRITATSVPRREGLVLVAFADVTEERLREERLAKTEAALREASARKDEFLAILSHELRNPLAAIRSGLSVQQRARSGDERANHAKEVIARQVAHLTRLVDDLLDVTRIARGKVTLQRQVLDLRLLLEHTVEDYRGSFEGRGIRLETLLGPGALWVDADPARLVQSVSNLLGNAEKFTPAGGRISVSLAREGGIAVLCVRDTGAGIAADVLVHVFEPFAQAPQTIDRSRGGLGLGLATVKGLIELHGGSVSLTSHGPGCGSEVTVRLPLAEAPAGASDAGALEASGGRRILVIEDNVDAAAMLCDELALSGNQVRSAGDGVAALELARTFRPDIVLCDIGLPGMDGYEVARAMRRDPELQLVYLVALSGYALPEDRQRAVDAGFDRHVAKPVGFEELDRVIAEGPPARRQRTGIPPAP